MNFVPLRWEKLDLLPSASDKPALNAVKLCVRVCVCVCVHVCVCVTLLINVVCSKIHWHVELDWVRSVLYNIQSVVCIFLYIVIYCCILLYIVVYCYILLYIVVYCCILLYIVTYCPQCWRKRGRRDYWKKTTMVKTFNFWFTSLFQISSHQPDSAGNRCLNVVVGFKDSECEITLKLNLRGRGFGSL